MSIFWAAECSSWYQTQHCAQINPGSPYSCKRWVFSMPEVAKPSRTCVSPTLALKRRQRPLLQQIETRTSLVLTSSQSSAAATDPRSGKSKGRSGKHLKLQTKWKASLTRFLPYNKNPRKDFWGGGAKGKARGGARWKADETRGRARRKTGEIIVGYNENSGQVGQWTRKAMTQVQYYDHRHYFLIRMTFIGK